MLYLGLFFDESFIFVIFNKKQLFRYWFIVATIVVVTLSIYLVALTKLSLSINLLEMKNIMLDWLKVQPWSPGSFWVFLLLLPFFVFCCFICLALFLNWLELEFRKYALALYLYYCQYSVLVSYAIIFRKIKNNLIFYFPRIVHFFTKNAQLLDLAVNFYLKNALKFFYVAFLSVGIYDYFTHNGILTKVFVLLFLFFSYSLIHYIKDLITEWVTEEHMNFTKDVYKAKEINGKIVRWVDGMRYLAENEAQAKSTRWEDGMENLPEITLENKKIKEN